MIINEKPIAEITATHFIRKREILSSSYFSLEKTQQNIDTYNTIKKRDCTVIPISVSFMIEKEVSRIQYHLCLQKQKNAPSPHPFRAKEGTSQYSFTRVCAPRLEGGSLWRRHPARLQDQAKRRIGEPIVPRRERRRRGWRRRTP